MSDNVIKFRRRAELTVLPILLSISKKMRALIGIKLAEINLQNGQDEILLVLKPGHPLSIEDLAKALDVRPSTVIRFTDRLIQKGLLEVVWHGTDSSFVGMTPGGLEARDRVNSIYSSLEEYLGDDIASNGVLYVEGHLRVIDRALRGRLWT